MLHPLARKNLTDKSGRIAQSEALGLSWLFPDLHNANWPKHRLAIVIHFTEYYLDHVRCRNIKGFRILPNPPIQEEMKMR